jgi:hypothetical protein
MLNRLELGGPALARYHRIARDEAEIEALFVDLCSRRQTGIKSTCGTIRL